MSNLNKIDTILVTFNVGLFNIYEFFCFTR